MPGVKDRVALVTGAGSAGGIGFAIAKALHVAGAKVAVTSTTDRIHDRAREIGAGVFATAADLTRPEDVARLVSETEATLGPIDILVNNAGMTQTGVSLPGGHFTALDEATWARGLDMNLGTAVRMTRAVLPGMCARGYGRVIHTSSVTGPVVAIAGSSVYATAKAGLMGLTRALALEVGPKGVTVNAVGPGWIETESSSEAEVTAGRHTPVGRPGKPEEVAHAAFFLAAEEASYVTGQLIVVDGGNTLQEYKVAL
ncbi:MAG TPA: SDR family NAD(P)-dependent oxidoreductase [Albidovulum sp.]|uniref:SDR family NAD(P)-dependent oxidoreductase n=1 Tax=Albidovulum sp. TaxID=1872424 RepID=UPI002BB64480|nr:SDR family NAD(P)-dependent oxidoreductase [Albidovulum sp.]